MKLLAVDCCIRGDESGTKRLMDRFLDAAYPDASIERLRLYEEPLRPLTAQDVKTRDELLWAGRYDHPMLRYACQLREADEIVVAAPYWDWSFPSLLKVYIENCCAVGVTFHYEGTERRGLCRAKRLTYLSTCGGYIEGGHMGEEYVRFIAGVFGIPETRAYHIEALDLEPQRRGELLDRGIDEIMRRVKEGE